MKKYDLMGKIETAIAAGIRQRDNKKWDEKVFAIVTKNNIYGLSMTDPDDDEFPDGCILVVQKDRTEDDKLSAIDWDKSDMIGKWIRYNYGSTDEMTDYIYETIAEVEGDYWYEYTDYAYSI